ncbi:MAG: DUF494 family protein [Legionella sp.]|nr:DUF494 family protein [Legionella sp.]
MKDSLFEMLMNFFEKSLSQITESKSVNEKDAIAEPDALESADAEMASVENQSLVVRPAHETSIRVFTYDEQMKFTKASYQFLMRMLLWGIIASESMELIINQLIFSESRFVTLQETKWTIRNTLAENLTAAQLAFLDLVLYQKEDELPLH